MHVIDESGTRTLARISASVPFVRSSLIAADASSKLRPHFAFASAVASWTIASGLLSSTARVEQVEHHRLGAEPPQQLCARRRVVGTDHIVACVDNCGTSRLPSAPLAPATKYASCPPFPSCGHIPRLPRVYFHDTLRGRNVPCISRDG